MKDDKTNSRSIGFISPPATEDVLAGAQLLRRVFQETPQRSADREAVIVASETPEPPVLRIERGVAYSMVTLPDGRRAILDLFLPGDLVGINHAVAGRTSVELKAANMVAYRSLVPAKLRELMADRQIALCIMALVAEAERRRERHTVALTRFEARARIAACVLDIYDRLRRRELVTRPTFNLPLTQEQLGDHLGLTMVHISRTFKRLREERLLLHDRQVVIITDLDGLRRVATGGEERDEAMPADSMIGAASRQPDLTSTPTSRP